MVQIYNSVISNSDTTAMADEIKQQRMARYKEERRRQLAAQFGRRDVAISDVSDPAYGIRSTRASRLRSAATSAHNDSSLNSSTVNRYATKRDTSGLTGARSPGSIGSASSSFVTTSPDTAKEKSPPLVPSNNSVGIIATSTPRKERDKSSKRKSNLNRQLNTEEVVQPVTGTNDDGIRRRRSRMVAPSLNTSGSSKSLSQRSSSTHLTTTVSRQTVESPKRLTPPRKLSERSVSASSASSTLDNDHNSRVTTPVAASTTTPSPPSSRIPKKVASSPSLLSSSSRESSPRHKSSAHRLSVVSTSHTLSQVSHELTSPSNISLDAITISNGPTNLSAIRGPATVISGNHINGHCSYSSNSKSDNTKVVEVNSVTNCNSASTTTSDIMLDSCAMNTQTLNEQIPQPNSPRHIVRPVVGFKKKTSHIDDTSSHHMPVSILKRKTSQEEGSTGAGSSSGTISAPPPVTFSPSVVDPVPGRRQGILKKHRSLDEGEVIRRRSCSPDVESAEFRPILKHQRRSSLEELHRRTQSPEPQSILKRKTSREEGVETNLTSEPQGILKRKTSTPTGEDVQGHITIADTVLLAITGGMPTASEDHVKPILKKKSFSGEEAPSEIVNSSDTPRPILKKKASIEAEDIEEKHHVKPILKLRKDSNSGSAFVRVSSFRQDTKVDVSPNEDCIHVLLNSTDRESESSSSISSNVVPILKKSESEPVGNVESSPPSSRFNKSVVWRNNMIVSTSDSGQDPHKRRSLDIVSTRDDSTIRPSRPLSVAERIMNMESFLASEGCSDSGSSASVTGAVPKKMRDKDRFRTQPITAEEISNSKSWVPDTKDQNLQPESDSPPVVKSEEQAISTSLSDRLNSSVTTESRVPDIGTSFVPFTRSDSVSAKASLFNQLEAQMKLAAEEARSRRLSKGSSRRIKAENQARFVTQPVTVDELEEAKRQNETNDPNTQDETQSNDKNDDADDENDPSKLSLAERVKLFNKKMINDRLNAPVVMQRAVRSTRFKTQPVTTEEVSTAQEMNSVSSKISRTASGILVSGILKNLAQKSGVKTSASSGALFSKTISDDEDDDDCDDNKKNSGDGSDSRSSDDDSDKETSSNNRGILKQKSAAITSARISKKDKQSEGLLHLRSVLKKESCDTNAQHSSDLHSILKSSRNKNHNSSESHGNENGENNENNFDENSKKINKNLDIVNLLHKVEAEARNLPLSEDNVGNLNNSTSDNVVNLKNLANISLHRRGRRKRDSSDTSEGDTSSSGGREIKKINNEAIARRRQAAIAKQAAERVKGSPGQGLSKSKSQSAVGREDAEMMVNGGGETSVVGGLRRCFTQPMPPSCDTVDEPLTIAQRLAALQKSGQTDWMKRVSKLGVEDELPSVNITDAQKVLKQQLTGNEVRQSASTPSASANGSVLAERLDQLQSSTHGWKKRVEPSDAVQFSVAGRMSSTTPVTSPVIERKKKTPRPARFRSKNRSSKEVQSTPTSPEAEDSNKTREFKRSVSAPSGDEDSSLSPVEIDPDETFHGPRVSVPKEFDENFSEFFSSANSISKSVERIEIKDEDLEQVISESRQKLVLAKRVKVQRRHEASGNPLKLLAARKDLCTDYVEVRSDVAQKEIRRLNVEKLSKNSSLAVEALAGLASTEDFTSVSLRKANSSSATGSMLPYKDLMLLHIKGRRHVQTRLVKPFYTSVNQGDSYVLVTPHEVYHWMGEFSNVIEKSRSCEVAQHIHQKKDLGCSASNIITLNGSHISNNHMKFWKLLGADDEMASSYTGINAGHPDEDELYEAALIDTNMMYYVEEEELVPVQKCWGSIPRIEILNPSKIIVFDFGTELYVWMGKNAGMDRRKSALQLAEELWSNGYDYTECDICPISAAEQQGTHAGLTGTEEKKGERPSWGLMAKVTQHMETVLFREKFLDWPDFSRVIRTKRKSSRSSKPDAIVELKPCNAQELLDCLMPAADLQLEGNHLGRGRSYFDEESRRNYEVATQSVNVWHIEEFSSTELPEDSRGQFYSDDSYVIRWLYNITVTGRELSGQPSKHGTVGRDRCAYFIWQGSGATLNDQGAAALITVQLDSERGPQIRVPQGSESPAFLSLFDGTAVIHHGKRGQPRSSGDWRLYICRGEEPQEGVLTEVSCSIRSLRSRASFLLVNVKTGQVYLWHGAKALLHTREVASYSVDKLTSGDMVDFGLGRFDEISFDEIDEGSEPKEFFHGLGSSNRQLYISLLNSELSYEWTPQLFHLSSMMGQFNATPVIPPRSHPNLDSPFPYMQEDLYSARQPALFLLNSEDIVWLWQGWVPPDESVGSDTEEQEELSMSSISMNSNLSGNIIRWQAERRAAMSTALEMWHLKHGEGSTPKVFLACAGLEPLEFTNLFPIWFDRDDIAEINIRDGRKPGELLNVEEELTRLTRSTYPVAQLLQRPLPEGVDPTRLEIYLSPQDFQELLGMTKEEFTELPAWKQTNLKKTSGLF